MAASASFTCHAQIAGVDETYIRRMFAVQLGIGTFRIRGRRVVPELLVARKNMRGVHRLPVGWIGSVCILGRFDSRIAAMAVGATEHHAGIGMHGVEIGLAVATGTTFG